MGNPNRVSGYCPHYDHVNNRCYLSECMQDTGVVEGQCKSKSNCKTCGNYEAWESGNNYRGK
ncbi:hypothetical protein AGMMS50268_31080 [Spirochaetia bacterium]|nr:hypothetical protein AGMMS50268_31080 [Spirochaetia bacterium]